MSQASKQDDNADAIRIGRRLVRVSNRQKVLYPQSGFTKGEVVDYYRSVAPVILKYLAGRPLTLKRYPNGVDGGFFYEKNCPSHRPDWVKTQPVHGSTGTVSYCLVDSEATLIWVANLASLELHTLLAKKPKLDRPTMMVFDLDPGPPATLIDCLPIAVQLRDTLEHMGLQSFPKSSGGKGFHIYVPLNSAVAFDQTKEFAHSLAQVMERDQPERVISVMSKQLRAGKVMVDWSQNDDHKTTVCAYSLRARTTPTVSAPLEWKEVDSALRRKRPDSLIFQASDMARRLEKKGDLFEPVLKLRQKLPKW